MCPVINRNNIFAYRRYNYMDVSIYLSLSDVKNIYTLLDHTLIEAFASSSLHLLCFVL